MQSDKSYIVSKNVLDQATLAISELIGSLEEERGSLCLEDMVLMYKLMLARNELWKLQLFEVKQEEEREVLEVANV